TEVYTPDKYGPARSASRRSCPRRGYPRRNTASFPYKYLRWRQTPCGWYGRSRNSCDHYVRNTAPYAVHSWLRNPASPASHNGCNPHGSPRPSARNLFSYHWYNAAYPP